MRGHHVYKTTWSPAIGQVLQVGAEDSNAYDTYAVATCLRDTVVGHMPRELSRIAWHFLQHNGHISCEIIFTGRRKYSAEPNKGSVCSVHVHGKARYDQETSEDDCKLP